MIIYVTFFGFMYAIIGLYLNLKYSDSSDSGELVLFIVGWLPMIIIGSIYLFCKWITGVIKKYLK